MVEKTVTLTELKERMLLWGDLIWVKSPEKQTCIGHCGDIVDLDFVGKLFAKEQRIIMRSHCDDEQVSFISKALERLSECELEMDRVRIRKSLVEEFFQIYLLAEEEGNLIDWIVALRGSFYDLPHGLEEIYYQKNLEALRRSQFVATLTTMMCLATGYLNWEFLKNVYNATLVMDIDFVKKGLSSFHLDKLEEQRRLETPSLNIPFLNIHLHHGSQAVGEVEKLIRISSGIKAMLKYHHEVLNTGKGPEGVFGSETSDLVAISSFCERIVPYKNFYFKEGDATGFLKKGIDKVDGYIRLKRIVTTQARNVA